MQAAPKDRNDINAHYSVAIAQGAATADEWVAELHDIPRAEAAKRVDENMERTAESMQGMTAYPEEPDAATNAGEAVDDATVPPADEPEEVDPVDETEEDKDAKRLANVNIYHLKIMVDVGAASRADMRMKAFGEDRATAERMVLQVLETNKKQSAKVGEIDAARSAAAGDGIVEPQDKPEGSDGPAEE